MRSVWKFPQVLREIVDEVVAMRRRKVAPHELPNLLVDLNQKPLRLRPHTREHACYESEISGDEFTGDGVKWRHALREGCTGWPFAARPAIAKD
jgi:hypothetical protein